MNIARLFLLILFNTRIGRGVVVIVSSRRMQFVFLFFFQVTSGFVLLFIIIHYIYYIINAVAGDLRNHRVLQKRRPCIVPTSLRSTITQTSPAATAAAADSEFKTSKQQLRTNGLNAKIATTITSKVMQTNDDAKYIKK